MYIPDEGCVFLYPDFSQAEARVVAVQARCQGLIELFTDPSRDVHRENAARIFGKSVESISPIERYLAKRVVHAANYGMEAKRLAAVVNEDATITGVRISTDEAQHLLIQYFLLYPEIKEVFWRGVERELKRTRTLTNPFGLQRTFYGRMDDALLREAYSWVPQSTVGWLGRMAWARTYAIEKQHPSLGLRTLCQVHDSILSQVPTENLHIAIPIILDAMRIPITLNGITFTIPVDIQIGSNWGHASEDNPNGLKEWAA
jgi:DNA polymerase-1